MLASHLEAENRYSKIRKEALKAASDILLNRSKNLHPVNEQVKSYYEKYRYTYVASGDYLVREVL